MDWPQALVEKFGVPLVVAAVICYYLRKDVVIPMVARIIAFFDTQEAILQDVRKRSIVDEAIHGDVDRRLANLERQSEFLCDMTQRIGEKLKLTGICPLPGSTAGRQLFPPVSREEGPSP